MPGKAGPEHSKRRLSSETSSSLEIFLLPGAYPIPKPSYGEPRRTSITGEPVITPVTKVPSTSLDIPRRSLSSSSEPQELSHSISEIHQTPESGLGSTLDSSIQSFNLLDKASLEKSTDSDIFVITRHNNHNNEDIQSTEGDLPPPLPSTPIPGTEAVAESEVKPPPLSGRERLKLIEEELSGDTEDSDKQKSQVESEDPLSDQDRDSEVEDLTTWSSVDFHNKRDKFERMASQDGGLTSSTTELNENHPLAQRSKGSLHKLTPNDKTTSETALTERVVLQNHSTHSLDSQENLPGSGAYVNRVKDESTNGNHSTHHGASLVIHKTSSDEDLSYSRHLDPHHKGPHYDVHKTSSEEDLSLPKVDVMANEEYKEDTENISVDMQHAEKVESKTFDNESVRNIDHSENFEKESETEIGSQQNINLTENKMIQKESVEIIENINPNASTNKEQEIQNKVGLTKSINLKSSESDSLPKNQADSSLSEVYREKMINGMQIKQQQADNVKSHRSMAETLSNHSSMFESSSSGNNITDKGSNKDILDGTERRQSIQGNDPGKTASYCSKQGEDPNSSVISSSHLVQKKDPVETQSDRSVQRKDTGKSDHLIQKDSHDVTPSDHLIQDDFIDLTSSEHSVQRQDQGLTLSVPSVQRHDESDLSIQRKDTGKSDHLMQKDSHDVTPSDHLMQKDSHDVTPSDHLIQKDSHDVTPSDHLIQDDFLDLTSSEHSVQRHDQGVTLSDVTPSVQRHDESVGQSTTSVQRNSPSLTGSDQLNKQEINTSNIWVVRSKNPGVVSSSSFKEVTAMSKSKYDEDKDIDEQEHLLQTTKQITVNSSKENNSNLEDNSQSYPMISDGYEMSRHSNISTVSGNGYTASGESDNEAVRVEASISTSSASELKRINLDNSNEGNEHFRAATPKDGRYIDPGKMVQTNYHFKSITTGEESSAVENEINQRPTPKKKKPRTVVKSKVNDISYTSVSDIGHRTENDGDMEFSDSDEAANYSQLIHSSLSDEQHLHGILSSVHSLQRKKESKVHFDESHLYETKFFQSQDGSNQAEDLRISSEESDEAGHTVKEGYRRQSRRGSKAKAKKKGQRISPPEDQFSKSVGAVDRKNEDTSVKTGNQMRKSMPVLNDAVIRSLVEQMKPLMLEEIATTDGQRETMTLPAELSNDIARMLSGFLHRAVDSIQRIEYIEQSDTPAESSTKQSELTDEETSIMENGFDDSYSSYYERYHNTPASSYRTSTDETIQRIQDMHSKPTLRPESSSEIEEHIQRIHYPKSFDFIPSENNVSELSFNEDYYSHEKALALDTEDRRLVGSSLDTLTPSELLLREERSKMDKQDGIKRDTSDHLLDEVRDRQLKTIHNNEAVKAMDQNKDFPPHPLDKHGGVEVHQSTLHALMDRSEADKSKSLYAYAVLSSLIKKMENEKHDRGMSAPDTSNIKALLKARDALEKNVYNKNEEFSKNAQNLTDPIDSRGIRQSHDLDDDMKPDRNMIDDEDDRRIPFIPPSVFMTRSIRRNLDKRDGIERQSSSRLVDKVRKKNLDKLKFDQMSDGVEHDIRMEDVNTVCESVDPRYKGSVSSDRGKTTDLPITHLEEIAQQLERRSMPTNILPRRPTYENDNQHLQTQSTDDRANTNMQIPVHSQTPSAIDENDSTYNVYDYVTPSALLGMLNNENSPMYKNDAEKIEEKHRKFAEKFASKPRRIQDKSESHNVMSNVTQKNLDRKAVSHNVLSNYPAISTLIAKILDGDTEGSDTAKSVNHDISVLSKLLEQLSQKKRSQSQDTSSTNPDKYTERRQYQHDPNLRDSLIANNDVEERNISRSDLDLGLDRATESLRSNTSLQNVKDVTVDTLQEDRFNTMISWSSLQKSRSDQEERVAQRAVPEALTPTVSFDDRKTARKYTRTENASSQNGDLSDSSTEETYNTENVVKCSSDPLAIFTQSSLADLLYEYCTQNPILAYSDPELPPELLRELVSLMSVQSVEEPGDCSRVQQELYRQQQYEQQQLLQQQQQYEQEQQLHEQQQNRQEEEEELEQHQFDQHQQNYLRHERQDQQHQYDQQAPELQQQQQEKPRSSQNNNNVITVNTAVAGMRPPKLNTPAIAISMATTEETTSSSYRGLIDDKVPYNDYDESQNSSCSADSMETNVGGLEPEQEPEPGRNNIQDISVHPPPYDDITSISYTMINNTNSPHISSGVEKSLYNPVTLSNPSYKSNLTPSELLIQKIVAFNDRKQRNTDFDSAAKDTSYFKNDLLGQRSGHTTKYDLDNLSTQATTDSSYYNIKDNSFASFSSTPAAAAGCYGYNKQQMTGASLPTSPSPDHALSTGRRSAMGTADARTFLVEKELIESQLRKLQVENTSLQTENKLLKEKYNRSQTRIQNLEGQLLNQRHEADTMHSTIDEMSFSSRKSRSHNEQERQDLEDKVLRLTRQVENLKAENTSLERQLENSRRTTDTWKHSGDRSMIVEGFRAELVAMREEVSKVKVLLDHAEKDRQSESDRCKDAAAQVIKLTEVKALLQQQIENSGGTVSERQVKSLETRLKITEDRFHQERADRAGKLSEVEEKLLNENARLQSAEKELSRQLQREKDKNRNLDNKYKDTKDDNEKLRIALGEKPTALQKLPYHTKYSKISPSLANKKPTEIKYILEQLQHDDGLTPSQTEDMVWLLWQRNEESSKLLRQWEGELKALEIDTDNITDGLKNVREEHSLYDDRAQRYKEAIDDLTHEKDTMQTAMQKQIHDLVSTKHTSQAHIKNLEDQNEAIKAENQSLKNSMKMTGGGTSTVKHGEVNTWEAKLETLQSEFQSTRGDLQQNTRQNQRLEIELLSLREQHKAKEKALDEALDELTRVGSSNRGDREMEQYREQKVDKLNAQVKSLETEADHWRDKHSSVSRQLDELEEEYSQLQRQMARAKVTADGRIVDPAMESEKLALETELNEKDEHVLHLTVSYNETENDLQRTKQLLVLQQQHADTMGDEMEQLHTEIRQKKLLVEKMASADSEHQVALSSLRENLNKMNKELGDVSHELKLKTVELNHQNSKVQKLERDLNERDKLLSSNITQALQDGSLKPALYDMDQTIGGDSLTNAETQTRLLQYEVDKHKHQMEKTTSVLESLVKENNDLVSQMRQLKQDVVYERAQLCQLTSDKTDTDKQLHLLEEENIALRKENANLERDVTRQEVTVGNLVERLEADSETRNSQYEEKYKELDKQGKMVAIELATVKRLLEARNRETDLLRDTIERQKQENVSLNRRIQVIKEDTSDRQQNIDSLTKELAKKMKETAVVAETSQNLASERARLQLEKNQLEKDQNKDHSEMERKIIVLQELQKKLEKADEKQRNTENQLHQKDTQLVALETELRHVRKELAQLENDKIDLRNQTNSLSEEIRHVGSVKDTLEQRLNLEKNTLSKEKSDSTYMRESLSQTATQLELVKKEYDILYVNLQQEKKAVEALKTKCQQEEDTAYKLQENVRIQSLEIDNLKHHLEDNKGTIEQYKKDKQTLYKDVQDLCKQLSEKDEVMNKVKERASDTVESMRHDCNTEKSHLLQEKQRLENELYKIREELTEMQDKLRHKENQIDMFMKTNKDLENGVREKYELENALSNQSSELSELRRTVTRLEADGARLAEANRNLQSNLEETKQCNNALKEEYLSTKNTASQQSTLLTHNLTEEKRLRELETADLREKLRRTKTDLDSSQKALASIQENRDLLVSTSKSQEHTVDSLKTQLYGESTGRKLAEQKVASLEDQIKDIRRTKSDYEEKTGELQARYAKIEAQQALEKEKFDKLKKEFDDLQSSSFNSEAQSVKFESENYDLKSENNSLRSQLDTIKQDMTGKNKRLCLEIKQHSENYEKDRSKLLAQAEQLAVDLDKTREQIAIKNKENLTLNEQVLVLESQLRESTNSLKHIRESLKLEEETRDKLDKRNMELELLIAKLRTKDGSDIDSFETTKGEVQKMLTELSRRMQDQLDTQKGYDSEARNRDAKKIEELKKKIALLESTLSQEQAMHIVSKTQLQSLEDDNQRLRQTLQSLRKRQSHSDHNDRNKSRIEAINEIIAKSQSQAQQMLASGNFNIDTDINHGYKPYNSQLPNSQYWMMTSSSSPRAPLSDHNRSVGSEELSMSMLSGAATGAK